MKYWIYLILITTPLNKANDESIDDFLKVLEQEDKIIHEYYDHNNINYRWNFNDLEIIKKNHYNNLKTKISDPIKKTF